MATTISTFDFDDFQALSRMTTRSEPFVATIAKATLAIVEARRDAEMRAATAEAALDNEIGRRDAIRAVLFAVAEKRIDQAAAIREIAALAS